MVSMPNRTDLVASILSSVPAIAVATLDETTFFDYLKNIFHSTPSKNNTVSILRWSIPSQLLYYCHDSTHSVRIDRTPSRKFSKTKCTNYSLYALAMIRDLSKPREKLSLTNIENDSQVSADKFLKSRTVRDKEVLFDAFDTTRDSGILVLPDFHQLWHEPTQLRALKETIEALENRPNKIILTFPPALKSQ